MNVGCRGVVVGAENVVSLWRQHAKLTILQVDDAVRVPDQCARVASEEMLIVTEADTERAAESGSTDLSGKPRAHNGKSVGSLQVRQRFAAGVNQVILQMRSD